MNVRRIGLLPILVLTGLLAVFSCSKKVRPVPGREYTGMFLGQSYHIEVVGDSTDYRRQIDSILALYAAAFDPAVPGSVVNRYNQFERTDTAFCFADSSHVFGIVFDLSKDLNRRTNQLYDPTTNPLKRAWVSLGYPSNGAEPDLDSLYLFTGYDGAKVDLTEVFDENNNYRESQMRKSDPRIELDYTPLAGAYAMDAVAEFLSSKNAGQIILRFGQRQINRGALVDSLNIAAIGISGDSTDQRIRLVNKAMAWKTLRDKSMMIDVSYGYPIENELVFVSVVAPTLAEAEAFSEAFMIMGLEQAATWYDNNTDSRIESFMLIRRGEEITSASTEGYDQLFLVPDSMVVAE